MFSESLKKSKQKFRCKYWGFGIRKFGCSMTRARCNNNLQTLSKNSKLFLNLRLRNSNRTMPLDFVRNRRKTFPVKSPWKRNIINFLTEILIILPFTLYHQGSCSIFLRHNESGFEEAKVEFFRTWKFSWIFVLHWFFFSSACSLRRVRVDGIVQQILLI